MMQLSHDLLMNKRRFPAWILATEDAPADLGVPYIAIMDEANAGFWIMKEIHDVAREVNDDGTITVTFFDADLALHPQHPIYYL